MGGEEKKRESNGWGEKAIVREWGRGSKDGGGVDHPNKFLAGSHLFGLIITKTLITSFST